jgi:hypothetical protein
MILQTARVCGSRRVVGLERRDRAGRRRRVHGARMSVHHPRPRAAAGARRASSAAGRPYADGDGGVGEGQTASGTDAPWYPRTCGGPAGEEAGSSEPASSAGELSERAESASGRGWNSVWWPLTCSTRPRTPRRVCARPAQASCARSSTRRPLPSQARFVKTRSTRSGTARRRSPFAGSRPRPAYPCGMELLVEHVRPAVDRAQARERLLELAEPVERVVRRDSGMEDYHSQYEHASHVLRWTSCRCHR